MRRLLLLTAAFLVFLAVAVPSAVVYYVVFTESGLQFIVRHIPHRFGNTTLEVVNPTGSIAHGIHVDRVVVDHHLVNVRVENLQAATSNCCRSCGRPFTRPTRYMGRVTVTVKRRTTGRPTPGEPLFVPRWMVINADHAHIGFATVTVPNGFRMDATDLDGSAVIRHRTIRLFEAQGQLATRTCQGKGLLRATDPFGLDVDTRINWSPDTQPAWAGTVAAKGNLASLALTIHTTLPFRADFTGKAFDLTNHWHWLGDAVAHDLDIRIWGGSGVLGLISGNFAIHGDTERLRRHRNRELLRAERRVVPDRVRRLLQQPRVDGAAHECPSHRDRRAGHRRRHDRSHQERAAPRLTRRLARLPLAAGRQGQGRSLSQRFRPVHPERNSALRRPHDRHRQGTGFPADARRCVPDRSGRITSRGVAPRSIFSRGMRA